jgi:uncharacterized membrane protein YkvA (DUF1232 family)
MGEIETKCLDAFPEWLKSLGSDARELTAALNHAGLPEAARRELAGAINYLFKSLDLVPDGIEDLGFVDDAFVLRVAAAHARATLAEGTAGDAAQALARLTAEAELIGDFLGTEYPRLERYVAGLAGTSARGRSVDAILENAETRAELSQDVAAWADSYAPPTFLRDDKTLVRLHAFLTKRLPA